MEASGWCELENRCGAVPECVLAGLGADALLDRNVLVAGPGAAAVCLEALRRGARSAVGLDPLPAAVDHPPAAVRAAAPRLSLQRLREDRLPAPNTADIVVMLGALTTATAPIALARAAAAAARDLFVIEFIPRPTHAAATGAEKRAHTDWAGALLHRLPSLNRGGLGALWPGTVASPRSTLRDLLFERPLLRDARFAACPARRSVLLVGRRRRHRRVLLIAGPDAAGKSTLIHEILHGHHAWAAEWLGEDPRAWHTATPHDLSGAAALRAENLLVHYNLLNPHRGMAGSYHDDPALALLDSAVWRGVLTLRPAPETLLGRVEERLRALPPDGPRRPRTEWLRGRYADPPFIPSLYKEWFEHCNEMTLDAHGVVDTSSRPSRPVPAS